MKKICECLKKYRSVSLLISSNVIVTITTVLQAVVVSRVLAPEEKGYFTEVIMWQALIASLAMSGLYTGIAKISAKDQLSKRYNISLSALVSTTITGALGILVATIFGGLYFQDENLQLIFISFSIYILVNNLNRGLSAINNGRRRHGTFALSSIIHNPTFLCLALLCYIFKIISIENLLICYLVGNFASLLFLLIKNKDCWSFNKKIYPIRRSFKYSIKYAFNDFAEPLFLYFDKIVIVLSLSAYDFGIYTTACSAASSITLIGNAISVKIFGDVANKCFYDIKKSLRINLIISLILAIFLLVSMPILIPLIFGINYTQSILPACVLLVYYILQNQTKVLEKVVVASGYPFSSIIYRTISVAVCIGTIVAFSLTSCLNLITLCVTLIITITVNLFLIREKSKKIMKLRKASV